MSQESMARSNFSCRASCSASCSVFFSVRFFLFHVSLYDINIRNSLKVNRYPEKDGPILSNFRERVQFIPKKLGNFRYESFSPRIYFTEILSCFSKEQRKKWHQIIDISITIRFDSQSSIQFSSTFKIISSLIIYLTGI